MTSMSKIRVCAVASMLSCWFWSAASGGQPKATDPADGALPALGASYPRKVDVAWNRFYDHAGLGSILARLHEAFPDLTELYSIGKSTEGRDLWCLEVTARNVGDPDRKPGMYIDGNIHGNEVQAGEVVAYTAWYLCHQYGRLDRVTALLDNYVFYLVPMVNPDGRDFWLRDCNGAMSARGGSTPTDNDRDGVADEDDCEDLNGDGVITLMRIKDPQGRWKRHPDYPEYLMIRAKPDEPGEYTLLGWEGIDNDGDGRVNEDGRGGYDMNRNYAYDWQPSYIQYGARDYPLSQPETRAVADFVLAHPNIAAAQCYHNSGGMILRGPGREGGEMKSADERLLEIDRRTGRANPALLPLDHHLERPLHDLGRRGHLALRRPGHPGVHREMWTTSNLYKSDQPPSDEEEAEFIKQVLLGDGVVAWRPYNHPTYGPIEIGGSKKEWGRTPPSFLLEEELHRNMAFTLYHAGTMPLLRIGDVTVDAAGRQPVQGLGDGGEPADDADADRPGRGPPHQPAGCRLDPRRRCQGRLERARHRPVLQAGRGRRVPPGAGGIGDHQRHGGRARAVHRPGQRPFTVTVDSARGGLLRKKTALP